jgi:hypothetical protein
MKQSLTHLSLEELAQLETDIDAERHRRRGTPLRVWDRDGERPYPSGGAILHVQWAVADHSYSDWYPTLEAANAALEIIAAGHERLVERRDRGYYVDLTLSGCHGSSAWVAALD